MTASGRVHKLQRTVDEPQDAAERAPALAPGGTVGDFGGERASLALAEDAPAPSTEPAEPSRDEGAAFGLTALGPVPDRKVREWALVLQSMSIEHAARRLSGGWFLLVHDADYPAARASIDRYELENRDWPPPRRRERLRYPSSSAAPIAFLALVAFFILTGPVAAGSRWFQHGTSVADFVVGSQPWRAVTALTLHADSAHVIGNAISGTLFGSAVHRRLGPGGGSLAILASGIAGNLANALFHHATGSGGHASIGASTAVFGAVGVLAATQLIVDRSHSAPRSWLDVVAPLVGGLALLGALGASPRADLGAHLFGFLAGAVIGLVALGPGWLVRRRAARDLAERAVHFGEPTGRLQESAPPSRWWLQTLLGAVTVGVLLGSWQLAFAR